MTENNALFREVKANLIGFLVWSLELISCILTVCCWIFYSVKKRSKFAFKEFQLWNCSWLKIVCILTYLLDDHRWQFSSTYFKGVQLVKQHPIMDDRGLAVQSEDALDVRDALDARWSTIKVCTLRAYSVGAMEICVW